MITVSSFMLKTIPVHGFGVTGCVVMKDGRLRLI